MNIEEILRKKYGATSSYIAPVQLSERSFYLKEMIDIIKERVGCEIIKLLVN